jgi:hypothetical protein
MPKWWNVTQNVFFYGGLIIMGYALVRIYYDRWQAPDGVCPTSTYQSVIYVGLTFAVIYFVMGIIEWVLEKLK